MGAGEKVGSCPSGYDRTTCSEPKNSPPRTQTTQTWASFHQDSQCKTQRLLVTLSDGVAQKSAQQLSPDAASQEQRGSSVQIDSMGIHMDVQGVSRPQFSEDRRKSSPESPISNSQSGRKP